MDIVWRSAELEQTTAPWRMAGKTVAYVPTMGNLHRGHLKLVEEARKLADYTVVSIFVNPAQFGPSEDFATYPRTPDSDKEQLKAAGCDLLFMPDVEHIYPGGDPDLATSVSVPALSSVLCGKSRPGHFDGVCLVVNKLFNLVRPDFAVFGLKDRQQFMIIRQMVDDLSMPVELHGVETVRETSGLAMSSRNAYLSVEEKKRAGLIYQLLCEGRETLAKGRLGIEAFEKKARLEFEQAGFKVDYCEVRSVVNLQHSSGLPTREQCIFVALRLGKTRLIDNMPVSGQL